MQSTHFESRYDEFVFLYLNFNGIFILIVFLIFYSLINFIQNFNLK